MPGTPLPEVGQRLRPGIGGGGDFTGIRQVVPDRHGHSARTQKANRTGRVLRIGPERDEPHETRLQVEQRFDFFEIRRHDPVRVVRPARAGIGGNERSFEMNAGTSRSSRAGRLPAGSRPRLRR